MCVGLLVCCLFTWQSEGIPQVEFLETQSQARSPIDYSGIPDKNYYLRKQIFKTRLFCREGLTTVAERCRMKA